MKYTAEYNTKWHDTDAHRIVRPSQILVYMQETSNMHLKSCGMSLDVMRDTSGLAFILSKVSINFKKPLGTHEKISVDTWTTASRGYSFLRFFEIKRDGEVTAKGASVWALVDLNSGKFLRADTFVYPFEHEPQETAFAVPRISIKAGDSFELLGTRKISYSDIDYNMHMNNTKYPDMLCDFLPFEATDKLKSMTISFLREAALGANIEIHGRTDENKFVFKTFNGAGEVCLEAEIETE